VGAWELTAVLAIVVVGLVLYVGVIDRPGEPSGQIELEWGSYAALAGGVLMLGGAVADGRDRAEPQAAGHDLIQAETSCTWWGST
jgi:hypothetical protein